MPIAEPVIIQCPQCNRSLPGQALQCQFCGASLASVARPRTAQVKRRRGPKEEWIQTIYFVVAGWWVFNGLRTILASLFLIPPEFASIGSVAATFQTVGIVVGGVTMVIGLGLIFKVNLARGIANILCWLQIFFGLLGMIATLGSIMIMGAMGVLYLVLRMADIAVAGVQVWAIAETDDYFFGS